MKVLPSVKERCDQCYSARWKGKLVVRCKKTRKHNQRQGN